VSDRRGAAVGPRSERLRDDETPEGHDPAERGHAQVIIERQTPRMHAKNLRLMERVNGAKLNKLEVPRPIAFRILFQRRAVAFA